jgi:uncharacterized membrane protein
MKIAKAAARVVLGIALLYAGVGHLTFLRAEFQAQVPTWLPLDQDFVVLASGFVEISLGLALLVLRKSRALVGITTALFFVVIFPGNVSQFVNGIDAFGLDSDQARLTRLFFQPVLIVWALWSTDGIEFLRKRIKT